jgi:hypothetical protein
LYFAASSSSKQGGFHVSENRIAGLFLKEKALLLMKIDLFADNRRNPQNI